MNLQEARGHRVLKRQTNTGPTTTTSAGGTSAGTTGNTSAGTTAPLPTSAGATTTPNTSVATSTGSTPAPNTSTSKSLSTSTTVPLATTPAATTPKQTVVTGVVTVTQAPSPATEIPIPTVSPTSGPPVSFFQNPAAVGATFTIVGLAAIAVLFLLVTTCIRRRRARRFDEDVSQAAAAAARQAQAAPPFVDDFDDRDFAASSSDRHHYSGPPMALSDDHRGGYTPRAYTMRELAQPPFGAPLSRTDSPGSAPGVAGVGSGGHNTMYNNRSLPRQSYGIYGNQHLQYTQNPISPRQEAYNHYGYPVPHQQYGYDANDRYARSPPPIPVNPIDNDDAYGGTYMPSHVPVNHSRSPQPSFPSSRSNYTSPPVSPHASMPAPGPLPGPADVTPTTSDGGAHTQPEEEDVAPLTQPAGDSRHSIQDAEDYTGRRTLKVTNE